MIPSKHTERGFTYIGVLIIMFVMMMALGAASEVWHVVMQHEKEQELLFAGHQYRIAINRYYVHFGNKYPPSLSALLETNDSSGSKVHYLRQMYPDPFSVDGQWGLVTGVGGGIAGVYSLSEEKPYKTTGFSDADVLLEGAEKYSDWKFVYIPKSLNIPASSAGNANAVTRPLADTGSNIAAPAKPRTK